MQLVVEKLVKDRLVDCNQTDGCWSSQFHLDQSLVALNLEEGEQVVVLVAPFCGVKTGLDRTFKHYLWGRVTSSTFAAFLK